MARLYAWETVSGWGQAPDDAVLVVGELAANAVRHARSEFTVALSRTRDAVLIEVADPVSDPPVFVPPPANAIAGRGLLIVDRLSRSWGTRPLDDGGKAVWAEIEYPR